MAEQPGFTYWECDECGFDAVTSNAMTAKLPAVYCPLCPLCAGDTGRDVLMRSRVAQDTDTVEGFDARRSG